MVIAPLFFSLIALYITVAWAATGTQAHQNLIVCDRKTYV